MNMRQLHLKGNIYIHRLAPVIAEAAAKELEFLESIYLLGRLCILIVAI